MRIITLIDNSDNSKINLETEHGLSFYFEIDGYKCMLDVGASNKFIQNATSLDIDVSDVDYLFLSHAHADHTGGLYAFLQTNSKAKIYLSSNISGAHYYSTRHGYPKDISIDYELIKNNQKRFIKVDSNTQILPSLQIITEIPLVFPMPKGNSTLKMCNESTTSSDNLVPDNFSHELALRITNKDSSYIILSSCSHKGVLNTLLASKVKNEITYIGGMHLLDSDENYKYETPEDLNLFAQNLISNYPNIKLITGHCTGAESKKILSQILEKDFNNFYSGYILIK